MKRQCPICGAENSEQAQFCRFCGIRIGKEPDVTAAARDAEHNQHPIYPGGPSGNEPGKDGEKESRKEEPDSKSANFVGEAVPVVDLPTPEEKHARQNRSSKQPPILLILLGIAVVIAIFAIVVLFQSFDTGNHGDNPGVSDSDGVLDAELNKLETWYVTNAGSALNVYGEANESSEVKGELYNGNSVKVKSKENDYWYIYSMDLETYGYVDKTHLIADRRAVVYGSDETDEERLIGNGDPPEKYAFVKYVYVNSGSLALRSAPSTLDSTSMGELYNYNPVYVIDSGAVGEYWYVYSPDLKMYGYVNSSYLIGSNKPPKEEEEEEKNPEESDIYYASVKKGYLALRNAQAFDASNEIGKLYNGDEVQVLKRSGTSWYVYAPKLDKSG